VSDARLTSREKRGGAAGAAPRRWRLALVAGAVLVTCGLFVWWMGTQRATAQASEGSAFYQAVLADLDDTVPASGPAAEEDPAALPVAQLEGVDVVGRLVCKDASLDLPVAALGEDASLIPALEEGNGDELVVRVPAWLAREARLDALASGDRPLFVQVNGARKTFCVEDAGTTSADFNDNFDLLVYTEGSFGEKTWVGCSQSS
jgi:hypothetical protein